MISLAGLTLTGCTIFISQTVPTTLFFRADLEFTLLAGVDGSQSDSPDGILMHEHLNLN